MAISDQAFVEIARDISASLRYLAELGCRSAECSGKALAVVRSWDMTAVRLNLMKCRRCRLALDRKRVVCGQGNSRAALIFVGGVPEPEDEQTGKPYSGPAGELLTRIIAAMELDRDSVYITHAVKCRPGSRAPEAANPLDGDHFMEAGMPSCDFGTVRNTDSGVDDAVCRACRQHLVGEIISIRPRIICALGDVAARSLSVSDLPVSRLRGRFFPFKGSQVMATFSPEHILRHPSAKRTVWEDVKKIMAALADA